MKAGDFTKLGCILCVCECVLTIYMLDHLTWCVLSVTVYFWAVSQANKVIPLQAWVLLYLPWGNQTFQHMLTTQHWLVVMPIIWLVTIYRNRLSCFESFSLVNILEKSLRPPFCVLVRTLLSASCSFGFSWISVPACRASYTNHCNHLLSLV